MKYLFRGGDGGSHFNIDFYIEFGRVIICFKYTLNVFKRISEYMNYSHVLLPAHTSSDAVERLELVATFAVSALASNLDRLVSSLASNLDSLVSSLASNLDRVCFISS